MSEDNIVFDGEMFGYILRLDESNRIWELVKFINAETGIQYDEWCTYNENIRLGT